jgi:hypothetical protein
MAAPHDLGDRLSRLEPLDPERRARYEEALRDLFERKLGAAGKLFVGGIGVASLGIAVFLGSLAIIHHERPILARIGVGGGAAFALAWTVFAGWTLRKGTWHGRIQPTVAAVLGWLAAVFLETLLLVLAPEAKDPYLGTVAILGGLAILVGAGFQLIGTRIQQSELQMREAFLRMEYRLAELAEELTKNQRR